MFTLIVFIHLKHFPLPCRHLKYPKLKIESVRFPGPRESRSLFLVFKGGFWEHSGRYPGERAVIFNVHHKGQTIFKTGTLPFLNSSIQASKKKEQYGNRPLTFSSTSN